MKKILKIVRFAFFATLALAVFSCSNGSDGGSSVPAVTNDGTNTGGGETTGETNPTTTTPEPTPTPTPAPVPAVTYVITFNANDGSENPATATQFFTEGVVQALKAITELGFSKDGFNFAGWGMSADATESVFANETEYTASADITFYALWSDVPVYSVIISSNEYGTITPSPATGGAGTEITLSNLPNAGYQFASYTVTDADGVLVTVTDGKFTLPAKNVSVTATFNAIYYNINVGTFVNGRVTANSTTATIGSSVTLTVTPASGYQLTTLVVTDSDEIPVSLSGTGNSRIFVMPAKNVTVTATFTAINYNINVGTFANGSVTASSATATVGTSVTLTATPASGYQLSALAVIEEGGASVLLSGTDNRRTFAMPARNVTVTAMFTSTAPEGFANVGSVDINGTTYDLVTFGLWPQTIKAGNVTVNTSVTEKHGAFTYCKGSDNQWYVKIKENSSGYGHGGSNYKYSDGTTVMPSTAEIYKWFKVEPIKWRVLTTKNNGRKKLLLAESILTSGVPFYLDYSEVRSWYGGIYPNNYEFSTIRAYLNGSYDETDTQATTYLGKGFLQSAFTSAQQSAISAESVVNTVRSTNPNENAKMWNKGNNEYASDTITIRADKVFLLSMQEVTTSDYGFAACNARGAGNARIKHPTDFALAMGAYDWQSNGFGGSWWLRSPYYGNSGGDVRSVSYDGCTDNISQVSQLYYGVVPALWVSN